MMLSISRSKSNINLGCASLNADLCPSEVITPNVGGGVGLSALRDEELESRESLGSALSSLASSRRSSVSSIWPPSFTSSSSRHSLNRAVSRAKEMAKSIRKLKMGSSVEGDEGDFSDASESEAIESLRSLSESIEPSATPLQRNFTTFRYPSALDLQELFKPSDITPPSPMELCIDFLNLVASVVYFPLWYPLVGCIILFAPEYVEDIAFGPGSFFDLPLGMVRFQHWITHLDGHVIAFLTFMGWIFNRTKTTSCAIIVDLILLSYFTTWKHFQTDISVPLGMDDRQIIFVLGTLKLTVFGVKAHGRRKWLWMTLNDPKRMRRIIRRARRRQDLYF